MKKKIINKINELTIHYYKGDFKYLNTQVIELSEILVKYIEKNSDELKIDEINEVLEELLVAIKKQDYVLVNDILNFFVIPLLDKEEN